MLPLSRVKFYIILISVVIIPMFLYFFGNGFFKQKNIIEKLEKNNDLTIEYFVTKENMNNNIDILEKNIIENKELNVIEKFNILNDCLFSCKVDLYKGKVVIDVQDNKKIK